MSHQLTFADSEFSAKRRQTRKEIFLSRMEQILPWQNMTAVIEPFYPKAGNGRRPYPLETMLRIHCMQHWYNLSDGAMEDALYEIASMRLFARLSLDSTLPDRTTIMNFRHLLEQHQLARHLIWKVEGDLSQFCCSLPGILRLLIVFLAVTGSGARIEGNLSPYPEGSLSH